MNKTTSSLLILAVSAVLFAHSIVSLALTGLPTNAASNDPATETASPAEGSPDSEGELEGEGEEEVETYPEITSGPSAEPVDDMEIDPATMVPEPDPRDVYVAIWAERIDAFNYGYPLEGYGKTFAEAAYDWGIDPRFSPAIARVESGSGSDCFLPHNAWGWGRVSWPDWDTAIREHVAGLAEGYGYTLTYDTAVVYNGATVDDWYNWVAECMYEIWPYDGY